MQIVFHRKLEEEHQCQEYMVPDDSICIKETYTTGLCEVIL